MKWRPTLTKFISLVLCLSLVLSSLVFGDNGNDYTGHWAEESIRVLFEKGFVTGYTDGTFKPDAQIQRAEFMAIVNRAFGYDDKADISFKDVKEGDWYYEHIARAVKAGYIKGFTDGTMRPTDNISRQEAAVILSRILDIEQRADINIMVSIKDGDKIPEWSAKGIAAVTSKGYMSLSKDGKFEPAKPLTRAEMAVAIEKSYVKQIKKLYSKTGIFTGGNIDGSVKIDNKDITLMDSVINGDLVLGEGIGDGNVHLINVKVKGETIVKGGGENSIVIENCEFTKIIIIKEDNKIRVLAKGNTKVDQVDVQSGAKLESESLTGEGFGYVTIAEGLEGDALVELIGNFESVEIRAAGIQVQASGGTIGKLEVANTAANVNIKLAKDVKVTTLKTDAAATITGEGKIGTAQVNVSGTKIEVPVEKVEAPAGVKVEAPKKALALSAPSTGGTGGGGGGTGGGGGGKDDDDDKPSIVAVTGVTLNKSVLNLVVGGESVKLIATVAPSNATNKAVTWISSNTKVATVANGVVTPVVAGTATITVKTVDGGKTATCIVTVKQATPEVNKELLIDAIGTAKEKIYNATIGNDIGDYPESAADALEEAIEIAQAVVDNDEATQEVVDKALADLMNAIKTFEDAVIKAPDTYKVTVFSNPVDGGTVTVTGAVYGENIFRPGGKVTVKAEPKENYKFINWTGDKESDENPYTFDMPAKDVSLTANFEKKIIPVSDISVTGEAIVGSTLTATLTPEEATVAYQWMKCDTADGTYTNIAGATSSSYTLGAEDAGKYIKITATGTESYSGKVTSKAVGPVEPTLTISNVKITKNPAGGAVKVGETLTLSVEMSDGQPAGDRVEYFAAVQESAQSIDAIGYIIVNSITMTIPATYIDKNEQVQSIIGKYIDFGAEIKDVENSGMAANRVGPIEGDEPTIAADFVSTGNIGIAPDAASEAAGKIYAEYKLVAGEGEDKKDISLAEGNVEYIKVKVDDGVWENLTTNTDATLWFNVEAVAGVRAYEVKTKDGKVYTAILDWQEEIKTATWAATGDEGEHDGKTYVEYKLLDGKSQVSLKEGDVKIIASKDDGTGKWVALEPNSDATLWFNKAKGTGNYEFFVVTGEGVMYKATLGWTKPIASTYKFGYNVPEDITENEEVAIDVTFQTDVKGDFGYDKVRFEFAVTGPEGSKATFKATDTNNVEHTFTNEGVWGPAEGFALPAEYTATTNWKVTFDKPGDYTIIFELVNLGDNEAVVTKETEQITVKAAPIAPEEYHTYKFNIGDLADEYIVRKALESPTDVDFEEMTPVKLSIVVDSEKDKIYKGNVRVVSVDTANMQLWAKDTEDNWHDINQVGWGPEKGFSIDTTLVTYVYVVATAAFDGNVTLKLVDVTGDYGAVDNVIINQKVAVKAVEAPEAPAKVKFTIESKGTYVSAAVGSDYKVKAVIPKGAKVDANEAIIKLEMTDIASLGIVGTRFHELIINTGIEGKVDIGLESFIGSLLALKSSTINGTFGDKVTYTLDRADTSEDNVWVMTPDTIEEARSAWMYLANTISVKTFGEDDSQIFIPKDAYLIIGNKKLEFIEELYLENITGNLSATEQAIRKATVLKDENPTEGQQMQWYMPAGAKLRIGQSQAELTKDIYGKVNGLYLTNEELCAILPAARAATGVEGMIKGSLDILNTIARGMNNATINVDVQAVEASKKAQ